MGNDQDEACEAHLLKMFPPSYNIHHLDKAAIILDMKKRVIALYVPNVLNNDIQVRISCYSLFKMKSSLLYHVG